MNTRLKAIVFKTPRLKETLSFFIDGLAFTVKESSPTHLVIHSKEIRVLFVGSNPAGAGWAGQANDGLEIELYLTQTAGKGLSVQQDPNNIKVIIA